MSHEGFRTWLLLSLFSPAVPLFAAAPDQGVSDPSLYTFAVARRDGDFTGSVLVAYKLNWQSVLFVGYGDDRTVSEEDRLEKARRQFFLKLSYAFQL